MARPRRKTLMPDAPLTPVFPEILDQFVRQGPLSSLPWPLTRPLLPGTMMPHRPEESIPSLQACAASAHRRH
jgi:hypothetical protein